MRNNVFNLFSIKSNYIIAGEDVRKMNGKKKKKSRLIIILVRLSWISPWLILYTKRWSLAKLYVIVNRSKLKVNPQLPIDMSLHFGINAFSLDNKPHYNTVSFTQVSQFLIICFQKQSHIYRNQICLFQAFTRKSYFSNIEQYDMPFFQTQQTNYK